MAKSANGHLYLFQPKITDKVVEGLYPGVPTSQLDSLAAEVCASLTVKHYDHGILAARVHVSNLHKETPAKFSTVMEDLYTYINPKTMAHNPMVSEELINIVRKNQDRIDSEIDNNRDFEFTYFGLKVKYYLL